MHAGYPYLEETVALMSVYPQVYADLRAIDWIIPREEFYEGTVSVTLCRAGYLDVRHTSCVQIRTRAGKAITRRQS